MRFPSLNVLSGWVVTFIIDERGGGPDSGYITSGKEDDASDAIAWAALGFSAELKKRKRSNNSGIDKDLAIDLSHLGILVGVVS